MGRLIDADALLKYLHDNHYASILEACMAPIIKKQPTAYDVEKVVAELEKKRNKRIGILQHILNEAINIVKRGGMDES